MDDVQRSRVAPEDIEWVDDGYGFISWKRGWPDFLGRGHLGVAGVLGLLGGGFLWWAGASVIVAATGAWFLAVCTLLFFADALGRILPDRYVILLTSGVLVGWTARAALTGDTRWLWQPVAWAVAAAGAMLALMILPLLLTGQEGLGAGDVKVTFPLALWLGQWGGEMVFLGLALGILLSGIWVVIHLALRRLRRSGTIALGPWLILGTLLATAVMGALP